MSDDQNKILNDTENNKKEHLKDEEIARQLLEVDEKTADRISEQRKNKVSEFKLDLDLDSEDSADELSKETEITQISDNADTSDNAEVTDDAENENTQPSSDELINEDNNENNNEDSEYDDTEVPNTTRKKRKLSKQEKTAWGCLRGIVYAILVIAISGTLAYFAIVGGLDVTGLNKSDVNVPVTLTEEQCKDTAKVAQVLKKAGVIDQPLIFRLYCKFRKADGKFMPQEEVSVSADMGYEAIINILKSNKRKIVKVTFPEGSTISDMAKKLEENNVCSASDFYVALKSDKYTHDFLNEIPIGEAYEGRFNKLEGYLFPDTYDFYVDSAGETVVRKFLDNFDSRVNVKMRSAIKAKGMKLNDAITLASIIQWEASKVEDMYGVSRVLQNRLNSPDKYPKLECDSTKRYINLNIPSVNGETVENLDYDTYKRKGLPISAINNPGLDAIKAVIEPSDDKNVVSAYFFATDMKTNTTYYSKTLSQHERICKRYGIGMYA